ncbi:MAG: hypothetical protein JW804_01375 [Sedimentisphaerales bacterium]|nr:hypothetical protein [Sedimentisphaerales bacterium]
MKISIDIKSLLIGFLLAMVVVLVMGQADGVGKSDFAIATERSGLTLVRADDGTLYVIDPQSARAEFIQYREGPYRKLPFNLKRAVARDSAIN